MQTIRDPLYGMIELSKEEINLINSNPFQRLRKIKQLALANMLYPGANHTRFEHSLGVMHIADRMAGKLLQANDKDEKQTIRYAALLHDIGHGPFSHVFELILKEKNKELIKNGNMEEIHEQITIDIIKTDLKIKEIIDSRLKDIVKIIKKAKKSFISKEIVSGALDADKYDYLMRDSYYTGVKYGHFDFDRILDTMIPKKDETGAGDIIAFQKDGKEALEQFLLAKYYMDTQVYRHRVRFITDQMILRGLTIAADEIERIKKVTEYKEENEDFINNYLDLYDDKIFQIIEDSKSEDSKYFFNRLSSRNLLKEVYEEMIKLTDNDNMPDIDKNLKDIEKSISEEFNININHVIVQKTTLKDFTNINPKLIYVGELPLEEISTIFKASDAEYKKEFIRVLLPVDEGKCSRIDDRDEIKDIVEKIINEIINK